MATSGLDDDGTMKWEDEAAAIINDVKGQVKEVAVSKELPSTKQEIYLNVTTLEEQKFCIRISCEGFQVVGADKYDTIDEPARPDNKELDKIYDIYETPYALLSILSKGFVQSFGNNLIEALKWLEETKAEVGK